MRQRVDRVDQAHEHGLKAIVTTRGNDVIDFILQFNPDAITMDINMPELNGLAAAERITREIPGVRVIILSMFGNEQYVEQALRSGASGYLLKDADVRELELAITAVMRGDTYLSPAAAKLSRPRLAGNGTTSMIRPPQK